MRATTSFRKSKAVLTEPYVGAVRCSHRQSEQRQGRAWRLARRLADPGDLRLQRLIPLSSEAVMHRFTALTLSRVSLRSSA